MECLVIGTGFVGSAIASAAMEAGWRVTAIDRGNYDEFIGRSFDLVINANGNAKKFIASKDPLADFDASTRSVYRTLRDFAFDRYVLISTIDVYSSPELSETTDEFSTIDLNRLSPYGFHKRLAEMIVERLPRWNIFRLGQMVGEKLGKGPIFDVLNRKPLWIHPQSTLAFLNTRSVARIVIELLERDIDRTILNVCGKGSVSVEQALSLFPPEFQSVEYADVQVQNYNINTARLESITRVPDSLAELKDYVRCQVERLSDA